MAWGELLMRGTIWIAIACYFSELLLRIDDRPYYFRSRQLLWTLGAVANLAHILLALACFHGWSHEHAANVTASRVEAMFGVRFGAGIYFNYVFALLWFSEMLWIWMSPTSYRRRPIAIRSAVDACFVMMIFSGGVVFATGPVRILTLGGYLIIAMILSARWLANRYDNPS